MMRPSYEETSILTLGRRFRIGRWNRDADPGLPPVLVFNGIGMNMELLTPLAAALAPRQVIAIDMPGVGKSPDPILPYSYVTIAMSVSAILDRLDIDRVDVIGISWGGGLALQFALQHRPRVRRVVLAATSAGVMMAPDRLPEMLRLGDPAQFMVGKAMQRALAVLYNGGGAAVPVSLNAAMPPSPIGWLYQIGSLLGWTGLPLLPLLDVPTLILTGDEDHIVPPLNARILHTLIPGSRLQTFAGGGHLFMLSHIAEVVAVLEDFLSCNAAVESV